MTTGISRPVIMICPDIILISEIWQRGRKGGMTMGLSDLFKPAWKKDVQKAIEAIDKNNDLMNIVRIQYECGFKGKDRAKINSAVVQSLKRLGAKKPESIDYLKKLAREGDSPLLRCQAAYALIDEEGMQVILTGNIIQAYADPGLEYTDHPEAWVSAVSTPDIMAKALESLSQNPDLRKKALAQIRDQNALASVILQTKDETKALEMMDFLEENEDIYIRIAENSKNPRCIKRAFTHISKPGFILKTIMDSPNEDAVLAAMDRFNGSEADYRSILMKNRFFSCRLKAVRKLGGITPDLIASVKEEDPKIAMELFDMADETELIELADLGLTRAIARLTESNPKKYYETYRSRLPEEEKKKIINMLAETDPEKYLTEYYDLLTEETKKKIVLTLPYSVLNQHPELYVFYLPDSMQLDMIDSGKLNQDILERLAMEGMVGDSFDSKYIPVRAYEKITNMGRQEHLLFNKDPNTFRSRQGLIAWRERLLRDLSFSDDIMLQVVQSDKFDNNSRKYAVEHITDPAILQQVAMEDSHLAELAAAKLPESRLSKLRNSKNPKVAKMGKAQYHRGRVNRANEKELLEIMKWEYANSDNPAAYLKALDRLENQEALCEAFSDYISSGNRSWVNSSFSMKPWQPVGQELLVRITDGPGLAAICLEKPNRVEKEEIDRLRELIHGTEEEQKFTDAAVKMLMTCPPEDWREPARLLTIYYGLSDAAHAAWRFGGRQFIGRVLSHLEDATEIEPAKNLGAILQFIYQQVPESHSILRRENGRSYAKHYDYYDSQCAGNNRDETVYYELKLN